MRAGDWGEADGVGSEASGFAWSISRRLFVLLAGTVLLLGLAFGIWGGSTSSAQTADGATRAAAASECKSLGGRVNYRDTRGQLLAYFYVSQQSCWDYTRITYLSQPRISAVVTDAGRKQGWTYDGVIRKRDLFFEYEGNAYGGHLTSRKGSFTVCPKGQPCYQKTPVVKRYAFYDNAGYQISRG